MTERQEALLGRRTLRAVSDHPDETILVQIPSFRDPELEADTGTQYLLTFDRAGGALLAAEVSAAGETVLTAKFSNFTTELSENDDTGNDA